ncbi:MAG: hypothetical protein WC421_03345 [Elusimicrobiales bacterium]
MKRFFVAAAAACVLAAPGALAANMRKLPKAVSDSSGGGQALAADTSLIDIPTAGTLDYYGLLNKTRFFSGGNLLDEVSFGVLPQLNLGVSAVLENFIGTGTSVRLERPAIQAKYRFYDGSALFPALAVGYDGQGYYYDRSTDKFLEKERGLYLAGTKSVFSKWFQLHPGVNLSDFQSNSIYLSLAASFTVEDTFALMGEWDNIQRFDQSRINAGARFYVSPFFQIDFALRDIGKNAQLADGSVQRLERVVQLRYVTSF